ncbi:hypothetical protein BDD12DRAFT_829568 [Trichophaea hybrida]|nr:hypothetical protein BDD12DRAFT_829568 [Trichophaea hybrida]
MRIDIMRAIAVLRYVRRLWILLLHFLSTLLRVSETQRFSLLRVGSTKFSMSTEILTQWNISIRNPKYSHDWKNDSTLAPRRCSSVQPQRVV